MVFMLIKKKFAGIAQLVEQFIRNEKVIGSTPIIGFLPTDRVFALDQ